MALKHDQILALISNELNNTKSVYNSDSERSLDYYLGNPNGAEVDGRSQVTSTDVADAIEWIMPQIMKSFTENNEVVTFDAIHADDEIQAEIESEYVYDVMMKQNDGFIIIHQFVKDALLHRNGIIKAYYDDTKSVKVSDYTGITEEELNVIAGGDNVEILSIDEGDLPGTFNVSVSVTMNSGSIKIESVPLEDFRVCSNHNSICLKDARFTAHVARVTRSDLIAQGYSKKIIEGLSETSTYDNGEFRHAAQGDVLTYDSSDDKSLQEIDVSECYMFMDINEDGVAERVKITVAGDSEVPTDILSVEEIDAYPWVTTTAIIMSHKFEGLSIYDRLKEIQDQKTSLWRNMFDNLYLQNNSRTAVVEGQVNIDDLLASRPGGVVRVKRLDALMPIVTPQISGDSYTMMSYLDEVKAGRTGVSADGGAAPQNIGDRVGSEGVERLMNAKEELVGLIIRVIAETGLKPLCNLVRDLCSNHLDAVEDYKFRGAWTKIHPTNWPKRSNTTVRVGTGSGDRGNQLAALNQVFMLQEKLAMSGKSTLVNDSKMYSAINLFCKYSGLNSAESFFVDPNSEEGQQAKKVQDEQSQKSEVEQMELQKSMAQSQLQLAEAELQKAKAQQDSVRAKAQIDMTKNELQMNKQGHEAEMKALQAELDKAKFIIDSSDKSDEMQFKYDQMTNTTALELTRIEADKEAVEQNNNFDENKDTISNE